MDYRFKNKNLIIEALTHKSFKKPYNNERLEFLGDAVLNLIVGEYLYTKFPKSNEGELSKIRASLVNETGVFMGEKFEVCCPKCENINTIQTLDEKKCKACGVSFSGKRFFGKISCSTISKLLLGVTLGTGGTLYTEYKIFNNIAEKDTRKIEQRIPIPAENT